jgi:hypothetical protein
MVRTLANLDYDHFIEELSEVEDHRCKYQSIIQEENLEMTAALFSNPKWIMTESYQQEILLKILKYFE